MQTVQQARLYASSETAGDYRKRLLNELFEKYPDARDAYDVICEDINSLQDEHQREHVFMNEVRHLYTYLLAPPGPGRIMDVWDVASVALARLKGYHIERPAVAGFNLERDVLPYNDGTLDGALLCEVIEHYNSDPIWSLMEINRVLRPGGFIILSTPNSASWFQIYRALRHLQPSRYAVYGTTAETKFNSIHAREYVPSEVTALLDATGFGEFQLSTKDYGVWPEHEPLVGFDPRDRGETIFCRAIKTGKPKKRYFTPLYSGDKDFSYYQDR